LNNAHYIYIHIHIHIYGHRQSFDRELAEGVFSLRPQDNAYAFVNGGDVVNKGYVRNSGGDSGNKVVKKGGKAVPTTSNGSPRMVEVPRLLLQDSTYNTNNSRSSNSSSGNSLNMSGDVIRGHLRHLCSGGKCNDHMK
jgi:hypothetical protein